jgi:hypothetical protein
MSLYVSLGRSRDEVCSGSSTAAFLGSELTKVVIDV